MRSAAFAAAGVAATRPVRGSGEGRGGLDRQQKDEQHGRATDRSVRIPCPAAVSRCTTAWPWPHMRLGGFPERACSLGASLMPRHEVVAVAVRGDPARLVHWGRVGPAGIPVHVWMPSTVRSVRWCSPSSTTSSGRRREGGRSPSSSPSGAPPPSLPVSAESAGGLPPAAALRARTDVVVCAVPAESVRIRRLSRYPGRYDSPSAMVPRDSAGRKLSNARMTAAAVARTTKLTPWARSVPAVTTPGCCLARRPARARTQAIGR